MIILINQTIKVVNLHDNKLNNNMKLKSLIVLLTVGIVLTSCQEKYKLKLITPKRININTELVIKVVEKNNNPIDSVQYFIDGDKLKGNKISIQTFKLGKHAVRANVYFKQQKKELTNTIYFLAAKAPKIYSYKIINEFPHDKFAFTQGLEYHDGYLYESTGEYGESTLRKEELKTGKVLQEIKINNKYFAEGITIFNNKIYQLTWQKRIGFIYNLKTFKKEGTFKYSQSKEGWGLTHNNKYLIKSDGSDRLWFLNPKTEKEAYYIEAYTNKRKVEELNELEYIKGKIYANVWQKNSILIINPVNGAIEGIIDLSGLKDKVEQHAKLNVLNGIAYDKVHDKLYVTGKNWSKIFEIKLINSNRQ